MAPWSYYRNLYSQVPAHIRTKMSRAYRNYDPYHHLCALRIPLTSSAVPTMYFNDMKPGLMDRSMKGYWDYDGHMDRVKAQEYSVILGRFLGGLKTGETNPDEYFSNAP